MLVKAKPQRQTREGPPDLWVACDHVLPTSDLFMSLGSWVGWRAWSGGGGRAVKWSLGRGALDSEACKHWPCLRQKSFISLPCIRQETSFNNPDSFHFWPQISDNVTSNVARISGRGLQITLPVFLPSSSLGWKSWLESWLESWLSI